MTRQRVLPSVFFALSSFCVLQTSSCAQAPLTTPAMAIPQITFESLLQEMTDADNLARWPQPSYINREASSYDRRTIKKGKKGWWANDDFSQFIRTEENAGRKEKVMMEADGPGALVRFWLTAAPPKKGKLRIYLDKNPEAAITFDGFDLENGPLKNISSLHYRHGSYSADGGGGTIYYPIPYAKGCKVTWEEGERATQRYYQINYRTYPAGTSVKTWTQEQFEDASEKIARAGRLVSTPPQSVAGTLTSFNQSLAKNAPAKLELPKGSQAVRSLELSLDTSPLAPEELERALRSVIIQISFDGENTVSSPVSDFFGSGVGLNELRNTFQRVTSDGLMRCRWVMPYQKNATITLTNLGDRPLTATLHATTSPWKWDARSMHFHANWKYEAGLKSLPSSKHAENTEDFDWNFANVQGRGVYVGDNLSIFNPVATWYGEGDEKIFVDGEAFPSHMGTGTEDYYGYSYAPKPVFQTPFVNHIRIDSPSTQGYNVMNRVRPLDPIPFTKSFNFDLELISWAPTTMTYASTVYWYGFPGASAKGESPNENAVRPVQTLAEILDGVPLKPNAIEAEKLKIVAHSPSFTPETQDMSPWDGTRWSRGKQLLGKAQKVGDFLELELPAPDNKARSITVHASQAIDYGILKFSVNGQASDAVFDGYSADVKPGEAVKLGTFTPKDGKFLVRVEVSGKNPKAEKEGTLFGIDYFEV